MPEPTREDVARPADTSRGVDAVNTVNTSPADWYPHPTAPPLPAAGCEPAPPDVVDQVNEAAELYAAGRSLAWLGSRYDVSHTTIAYALRRQGVPSRPRPGWISPAALHEDVRLQD